MKKITLTELTELSLKGIPFYNFIQGPTLYEIETLIRRKQPIYIKISGVQQYGYKVKYDSPTILKIKDLHLSIDGTHVGFRGKISEGCYFRSGERIEIALLGNRTGLLIRANLGITLMYDDDRGDRLTDGSH